MNSHSEIQDPRRLETVMSAKDFSSLYTPSTWKRELMSTFIEALGKSFGTELLLRVPENLREVHPYLFKNLTLIDKLRKAKLVERVEFFQNVADEPPIYRVRANGRGNGGGAHFLSPEYALRSALGECVERSLWFESEEWLRGRIKTSSQRKLPGKKLDLHTLAGFSDEQKKSNPLFRADEDTPLGWMQAKDLISGEKMWVPVQLLSAAYSKKHQKTPARPGNPEPLLRPTVTTGLATSPNSIEEAMLYGALETIERDAFMISWLNRLSPPRLDLEDLSLQDPEIYEILRSFKRYRLRPELLLLPTDFPFHAVAGVLIDETGKGPAFVIGAKAHWDLKRAILGALSEAASVRHSLKNNYSKDVDMDNIGRKERLIYWGRPDRLPEIGFFTEGKIIKAGLATDETSEVREWDRLRAAMRQKNYALYAVDISSRESKNLGFHSAYVFSPELQPMHLDERVPAFGGPRLKEIPVKLGYMPAETVHSAPHPFP